MSDPLSAAESSLSGSLNELAAAAPTGIQKLPRAVTEEVHRYCEAARAGGLPPEQALIRLKAMVASAYPRRDVGNGLTATEVVWQAVQRCVKAFYGSETRHR